MRHRSFLYIDVASQIRSRIVAGGFAPGSRLPSMSELVDQFNVSAITIRSALGELMHEGLVEGRQGLGVFVRTIPKIHRILAGDPNSTIGDEIARAGFTPRLVEIDFSQIKATSDIASRLKITTGSNIFRHQKVTYADEEPVALHTLHMRPKLAHALRDDLNHLFIFRLLEERKLSISNLKCEFSAAPLSEEHARIFRLQPGQPMMRIDYTHQDEKGFPLLLGQTISRADRFVFEVNLPRKKGRERSPKPISPARNRTART
jgi:GntR family transcriptional regulator